MKTVHTDLAPKAIGPYVQGKIANGFLFASGQVPLSPETGEVIGTTIEAQTEQVIKNIGALLAEAGTDFDHVVKTTCFLSDIENFVPFNEVYKTAFKADFPARSAVEVARLPKDVLIEIEVIALIK
ncbi:MAG: RidA family protein [Streptococcaceae bacterium]|jgi:reactive intermediate/imine deaminase|nr:RidA family protein [Streptococcaceae bacterium]MCH4177263.1 RidA family protein [Streptococcaceae bacterium]